MRGMRLEPGRPVRKLLQKSRLEIARAWKLKWWSFRGGESGSNARNRKKF